MLKLIHIYIIIFFEKPPPPQSKASYVLGLREGKTKIQTWKKLKQKLRKQFFSYNHIQTHYSNLHNCKTNSNAVTIAVLIETQQTKRSQSAILNSRTSPSGGAALNFTKHWRQPTKTIEIRSNTTGSSEVSKIPAKNQPNLVFNCLKVTSH